MKITLGKLVRSGHAIVFSFLCIAGLSFYWIFDFAPPTHMIVDYANAFLKAQGFKLSYDNLVVRANKIIIEGVVIDGPDKLAVSKIEAAFSIDASNLKWTVQEVKLVGIHSTLKASELEPLLKKIMQAKSTKKSKDSSSESDHFSLEHIVLEDVSLNIYLTDNLEHQLEVKDANFKLDLEDKIVEGEIEELLLDEEKLFEDVKINAKASQGKINYLAHNAVGRTQGYWSLEGALDLTNKTNTSLIKFSGIPTFLPTKVKNWFANDTDQLSALKVSFPLERKAVMPFEINYGVTNLKISHPILSNLPVGPAPIQLRVAGDYLNATDQIRMKSGSIKFKPAGAAEDAAPLIVNFSGDLKGLKQGIHAVDTALVFNVPKIDCQAWAQSIPKGLMPVLADFALTGQAQLDLTVRLNTKNPEDFQHYMAFHHNCEASPLTTRFAKETILAANSHSSAKAIASDLDPSLATYISSEKAPPYLLKAFVAFEDSGFFNHAGFESESIVHAFRTNFQAGKVAVGGSTISMQMTKNLFLSHDRTLQRKLQEIFLTWYVEKVLSKKQILEIYANIIEFGPGIYGISDAAKTLFGKPAEELSIRESIYLASILPSPVARFKNFCRGGVTKAYHEFLDQRLYLMHSQGRLSDAELQAGLTGALQFQTSAGHPYCQNMASLGPVQSF